MKLFQDVEQARKLRHLGQETNTIHRSSLIAPRMDRASTHVSFLNHFLLKRNITSVVCKLSAIDAEGAVVAARAEPIDRPAVYAFDLDEMFGADDRVREYMIEFFSDRNLVVPYPAVMVNHRGDDFINEVHSYNRTLNDIFEDAEVNRHTVSESSIEVDATAPYDTFFSFATGPFAPREPIEVVVSNGGESLSARAEPGVGPMTNQTFLLSDLFPRKALNDGTVLKIGQPRQPLFYGRLLSGIINTETGAFSANHSYYDNSVIPEYFDNRTSSRLYPYFQGFLNRVKMYPIMSPGTFDISVDLYRDGAVVGSASRPIVSPSGDPVTFDVDEIARDAGAADCTAFEVRASAPEGARIPTRVMHQLIYGVAQGRSRLRSSIAVGLINPATFKPKARTGFAWGQLVAHPDYESRLGVCFDTAGGEAAPVTVQFYSQDGLFMERTLELGPGAALIFDEGDFGRPASDLPYVWYLARSGRPDLSAQSFHAHRQSHNASGEHSF